MLAGAEGEGESDLALCRSLVERQRLLLLSKSPGHDHSNAACAGDATGAVGAVVPSTMPDAEGPEREGQMVNGMVAAGELPSQALLPRVRPIVQ